MSVFKCLDTPKHSSFLTWTIIVISCSKNRENGGFLFFALWPLKPTPILFLIKLFSTVYDVYLKLGLVNYKCQLTPQGKSPLQGLEIEEKLL